MFSAHVFSFLRIYCVFCECIMFSASKLCVFCECVAFSVSVFSFL